MQELRHNLSEIIRKDALNHIETQIVSTYNLLIHNYQTVYVNLNEIETSFALSRLGILHQSIINCNSATCVSNGFMASFKRIGKHK